MYNRHVGNKNNLRTIEAQIVQKLKNNEVWPKFTGSYIKKKHVLHLGNFITFESFLPDLKFNTGLLHLRPTVYYI